MKIKKKNGTLLLVILAISICYALTYIPHKIVTIMPAEVATIKIFDGNTGKSLIINDRKNIEHIIGNLNTIKFRKGRLSSRYKGYSFNTTIYKINGEVYKQFIINSVGSIRKDPFFYIDSKNSIDYDYIRKLISYNNN
ncbi:hypothetical protein K9O30_07425 [Clostridium bowmanii]|uniref:hypothetical protein n=1 Tax=Clostridium bowmanii TaxID=132925 RepID=UPI001C0C8434|nr:hypothetical protein [Clostridium bowmanii]MBU3189594.1 hypothetical protein [Clostridium bowmanii]MCA1073562.1 hypothetical protein [Clostridium bowmanii]